MPVYRRFEKKDAHQVHQVARKAWYNTYNKIFDKEFIENFLKHAYSIQNLQNSHDYVVRGLSEFFVAEEKSSIIGFAHAGYSNPNTSKQDPKNEITLFRIYINPEYLGKKIGSNLLNHLEEWILGQGRTDYGCYCHKENKLGRQFYEYKGFTHVSERDNIEDNEIFYLKKLN